MYLALQAAQLAPTLYEVTYNYLVDTSQFASSSVTPTFAQIGLYVNGGDGFYAQDFGATKEVQLSGAQLASGQVITGMATVILGNDAAGGNLMPPVTEPETFWRLGLIENSDHPFFADLTNITIQPIPAVPEPATLSLGTMVIAGLSLRRRRLA
jgi:hypothetical protein